MTTILSIFAILCYTAWREWLWHNERKDLYNRLMAKDLTEYRAEDRPPPKSPQSKVVKVLHKQYQAKGGE